MWWNVNKAKVRLLLWSWIRGQTEVASDKLAALILHVFIKDDLVQTLSKVEVDFGEKSCCI